MPQSLWLEWMEWMSVRGPIGGPRADFHTSFLAMHSRAAHQGGELSVDDFRMPWVTQEDIVI